ncbi:hypothetical protein [Pseudomonas nitroreducens]|uniref:hypothetical protein n=1 Tax=Pseudomonas nitroreducens TaxID=46680 RepID=UPI00351CC9C3
MSLSSAKNGEILPYSLQGPLQGAYQRSGWKRAFQIMDLQGFIGKCVVQLAGGSRNRKAICTIPGINEEAGSALL